MNHPDFKIVKRLPGDCWLHKCGYMWIVYYPLAPVGPIYQAYCVVDYLLPDLKGRDPWTLNNQRLNDKGFASFESAVDAINRRLS